MRKVKILIVGMVDSIHMARWVSLIDPNIFEVRLFPAQYVRKHSCMPDVPVFYPKLLTAGFTLRPFATRIRRIIERISCAFKPSIPKGIYYQPHKKLEECIENWQPDILHALEFQHAGYLCAEALAVMYKKKPVFGVSNWGSDIFLYHNDKVHYSKIRGVLEKADFYSAECRRDNNLVKELFSYNKAIWPVFPSGGGITANLLSLAFSAEVPSKRRVIVVKGYQHFAGRALTSLKVLETCKELLKGYKIVVFSPGVSVRKRINELRSRYGLNIDECVGYTQEEMLKLYCRARVFLATSISDGVSTSMVEAMAMGCFPIQSNTACCMEWFKHGKTGYAPAPDNINDIVHAFVSAMTEDDLVDKASIINQQTVKKQFDFNLIKQKVNHQYSSLVRGKS